MGSSYNIRVGATVKSPAHIIIDIEDLAPGAKPVAYFKPKRGRRQGRWARPEIEEEPINWLTPRKPPPRRLGR